MIYLDYAATSFVKPKTVYKAVYDTMVYAGANAGRGGHSLSMRAGELVYETREKLCRLFHVDCPEQFSFFPNATYALNTAIKGIVRPGDHIVASTMEHNSVLRPLEALKNQKGITYTLVKADAAGHLLPADFKKALTPKTRLVICTHASNVCGNIYDINAIRRLAQNKGIYFMVDASQSAGILDIEANGLDLLAFPGHKGLYGPQGSGCLYVKEGLSLLPLIEGGTGSQSELLYQPKVMPDLLESGTLNVPAIAGLGAGLDFILREGTNAIFDHEKTLKKYFFENLKNIPNITIYGDMNGLGVVALNLNHTDCTTAAYNLSELYSIAIRSGLHCAPLAHQCLRTGHGCMRFSFGYFTKKQDVDKALYALHRLAKNKV